MSQPNAVAFQCEPSATAGPSRPPLSAVIITMNEADRIVRCVQSLLPLCDEVVVLDAGRVVERGAPGDLLASRGRFSGLHARQLACA